VDINIIIGFSLLAVLVIQFVVILLLLSKSRQGSSASQAAQELLLQKLLDEKLDKNAASMRDEFGRNRDETNKAAKESREELSLSLKSVSGQLMTTISGFTGIVDNKMKNIQELLDTSLKFNREELNKSIAAFEQKSSAKIEALTKDTRDGLEKNRETVEKKLSDIQKENEAKLEQMRQTVDEKLHKTLEARLGEKFKQVSELLENVYKGLGEMQGLASDVGDLKKVMTNVKTKGILGEYQLASILEQMLAPYQYDTNVKTKAGGTERVEFAIKIPGRDDPQKPVWLPIDSKLPTSGYEALLDAYNSGDKKAIEDAQKAFARTVKSFAKDIRDKYIDPPNTTDFAIMFLPFEGAYAEVVRDPELFESIQREFKINIAGPSTISAFLNALQVGFRSLVVEKRTSEIQPLLGEVKKEFENFEAVLLKVKEQIDKASTTLEKDVGVRTRKITRALKNVETLPGDTSGNKLIEDFSEDGA
jgi:DNA recombination protein RmuC